MRSDARIAALATVVVVAVAFGAIQPLRAASTPEYNAEKKAAPPVASRRRVPPATAQQSMLSSAQSATRVIVGFAPGGESTALVSARGRGARLVRRAKAGRFAVLEVPAGTDARTFAASLSGRPGVSYAEPDGIVRVALASNDPLFSSQWGMTRIQAPAAWDASRGENVKVAVIDTGVDLDHPDLMGRIDGVNDYDFVATDDVADDEQGHGTHVAGIIAATLNNSTGVAGVANLATILPVRVLDASGTGNTSDVADGIAWAVDRGADVINLSLTSPAWDQTLANAVADAQLRGCVVVAAAGNEGAASISYPARFAGVIGVGSVGPSGALSLFSNYGTEIDVCAPGEDVMSTLVNGWYGRKDGTSMAAPHVAGVAALVRSAFPTWTPSQVQQRLKDSAVDLGSTGADQYYGYGLVQAAGAVGMEGVPPVSGLDDDIPGVEIPGSPVSGTVGDTTDPVDVYSLSAEAGRRLVFALTGPASADLDLHVFRPGASGLATDHPIGESVGPTASENLSLVATESGTYYVAVKAYAGAGDYGLSYAALPPLAEPDDDIPGVQAGAAPLTGFLDANGDTDDVAWVDLQAGQRIAVSLAGSATTDYDAYLYQASAASVWVAAPVASAIRIDYPDRFSYVAPADGRYYLDVNAYGGSGGYVLEYQITDAGPDDDIPGVHFTSNPQTGTLEPYADENDVYAIPAKAGQVIDLALTSPTGADFDLYLYSSSAASVYSSSIVAKSVQPAGVVDRMSYRVPATATYYARVYAFSGTGSYRLHRYLDTALTLSSSAAYPPAYGHPITLSARLTSSGSSLPGGSVLFERLSGGSWLTIGAVPSGSDGLARIWVIPYANTATTYRARFAEVRASGPAYHASTSAVVSVVPRASITAPTAPTSIYKGKSLTAAGFLKPRHSQGSYPVRIYKQRYVYGRWVSYGFVYARASDYSPYATKYSRSISLPYRGRWRLRAYHADSSHAASFSSYRYVTVK